MSNYAWKTGVSGDWATAADWTGGVPNDSSAAVSIAAAGTYTVSIAGNESFTVGALTLNDATATLGINGTLNLAGTLTLTAGRLFAQYMAAGFGQPDAGAGSTLTYIPPSPQHFELAARHG